MRSPRPGAERLRLEELCRHRVDVAEVIDVLSERGAQLVKLGIAGTIADQHLEAQAGLARLSQEERDVGVVAGVQDDVGLCTLEFGHQRGQVGRRGRVALTHRYLEALFLGEALAGLTDADSIRSILVDDGNLDVRGLLAELRLGVVGEKSRGGLAVLVGMHLRAERVGEVAALDHRGGDGGRDPENLFLLLHLGSKRHGMGAGVHADHDVDLLLVDQALYLVDGGVGLALGVRR